MVINTTETWLIEIVNFYFRFGDYESRYMILSINEWWNFHRRDLKHDTCWGIL
jgi:hypothetical protein